MNAPANGKGDVSGIPIADQAVLYALARRVSGAMTRNLCDALCGDYSMADIRKSLARLHAHALVRPMPTAYCRMKRWAATPLGYERAFGKPYPVEDGAQ